MEIPSLCKILREYRNYRELTDEQLIPLLEGHRITNTQHHEELFQVGNPATHFAIVLMGAFKLVRYTPRGEDSIMYFATPGDVIGGLLMLKPSSSFPISAIAMGQSSALLLPRSTYQKSWATSSTIQTKFNSTLYDRMSALQDDKANSKLSLEQKIAGLFLTLLDKHGKKGATRLPIPLTRQEIADTVGASVESVIRCMSSLSQRGLIKTEEKQIEILRIDQIAELLNNP